MKNKAKPPTKREQKRMAEIPETGCLACWIIGLAYSVATVHHIVEGGKRLGHKYTIGLCPWHHQSINPDGRSWETCQAQFGSPLSGAHANKKDFVRLFGTERELCELQDKVFKDGPARAIGEYRKLRGKPNN